MSHHRALHRRGFENGPHSLAPFAGPIRWGHSLGPSEILRSTEKTLAIKFSVLVNPQRLEMPLFADVKWNEPDLPSHWPNHGRDLD